MVPEIYYTVPETWYMIDVIFLILGYTLPFYPLNSPKNENLKKKNAWNHHDCDHDDCDHDVRFLRYGVRQMDGNSDLYWWVPHLKMKVRGTLNT